MLGHIFGVSNGTLPLTDSVIFLALRKLLYLSTLIHSLILNVWLGLDIWHYSDMPMNFMGHILRLVAVVVGGGDTA